jgi:nucleoside-triphosphatase THEP1
VNAHFRRVREHQESAPERIKLWILDEIGPLELSQGSGFLPALEKLVRTVSADTGEMTAVVVVRPALIAEVEAWFQREGSRTGLAPEVEQVYLTPENRDSLPSRLASRVYE